MSGPPMSLRPRPGYTRRRTMSFLRPVAIALLVVLAGTAPAAVVCALACAAPAGGSAEHSGHHAAHHGESVAAPESGGDDTAIAGTTPCVHPDAAVPALLSNNFRLLSAAMVSSPADNAPLIVATAPFVGSTVTAHGPPGSPAPIPLRI